ncbi:hypothetical protein SAMN05660337_0267 [Maridesulfovibrio ferrireducens]|uniref:Uncharacterized protein n=1 Tax=Maridesulfovibrio ferrireducens TaxID=246191 RepID=A0A1G9BEN6_9BACT|nr:hypothetical protein [Maridesulfovibrio ferrireducens]SDK37937.1 hypothetical protein SAMN05660337_0267 [Maridesulfovibrio ferrireducens]
MADAIKEAARVRREYGWNTYLIKFRNYYSYTFDPTLFPNFELIGEVNEEGAVFPTDKPKKSIFNG